MTPKEILKEMFILQQQLNDETNGVGWESGYTKNNKLINWKRCIYMECAELIDSFAWKHWKSIHAPTNWGNVKVEVVDIWHFVMSLLLEHYSNNSLGDIEKIVDDVANTRGFQSFCKESYGSSEEEGLEIVNMVEKMIHITSGFKLDIFDGVIKSYFDLALKCGINLQELYRFYVAKNVLNKFRQEHGYKEGTYRKIWGNVEDNEVMLELLKDENRSIDELYKRLEELYKES